jgi:hypothetical protein
MTASARMPAPGPKNALVDSTETLDLAGDVDLESRAFEKTDGPIKPPHGPHTLAADDPESEWTSSRLTRINVLRDADPRNWSTARRVVSAEAGRFGFES